LPKCRKWQAWTCIRRIRPFVSSATLKLIYNAIAQPYFDYCSPLWDNCGIGLKDRTQKFQNRAATVISGATYDVRSVDLLESLGWKHLELRRNYLKSVFMYKILNNQTAPYLRTSFRWISNVIIPMTLEIEKPIRLFLNRIPILVKDASNITER
jgi:hypothetical protein